MSKYSAAEVKSLVKDLKVRFITLQFTDILGITKNVSIPVEQLDKALAGEMAFDGSSIEGFVRIEESDMLLAPDPNSFTVFPWTQGEGTTARLICDVYDAQGDPFDGCPRCTLKRAITEAEKDGYNMFVGPEPEFFLFERTSDGRATTESQDQASYFDLSPIDRGENARRDIVLTLQKMGFEIEASHHEVAPAQHEIDFKYADALTTADNIATFRVVVRMIAMAHNLHATFMPKPVRGINGSGMHLHMSLFKGGKNAFFDADAPRQLSDDAMRFLAGVLEHAHAFTAITNPLVNSFKRLVPGYEAPVYVAWSERNRSPLIRIPAKRGPSTRVELRSPDPSCNPYLALSAVLRSGLDGMRQKLTPPPPVDKNIYTMNLAERQELNIAGLPGTLGEALTAFQGSELMREAIGSHIFNHFLDAKGIEWDIYRSHVHPWEIDQYLATF